MPVTAWITSNSEASIPVSTNKIGTPPLYPVLSRIFNSETTLSVAFTESSGGIPPLTKYQYALNGSSTFLDASGTSSPIIITGLTADTSYNVTLRAVSGTGDVSSTDWIASNPEVSNTVRTYKKGTTPSNLVVSRIPNSETSLSVAFTESSGGNPALTKYQYSLNGGATFLDASGTSSPIIITGLTSRTYYSVLLRAVSGTDWTTSNSTVSSLVSTNGTAWITLNLATSNTVITNKIGTTPTILSVSRIFNSETTLSVAFTESSGGYPLLTKYQYSLNGGSFLDASGTSSPITITGLTADTSYNVTLRAVSGTGDLSSSDWITSNSGVSDTIRTYKKGTVPSNLAVSPVNNSETSLRVTFTESSGGYPPLTKYQYSLNGGSLLDASGTSSPIIITDLSAGTFYSVRLLALSDSAWTSLISSDSSSVSTYKVGTAPYGLSVSPINNSETTLSVSFIESSGGFPQLTKYRYALNGGSFLDAFGTSSPIIITGLTAGTSYSIRMLALSGSAWTSLTSSDSSSVSTYKKGSAPSGLVLSPVYGTDTALQLSFSLSSGGYPGLDTYKYSYDGGNTYTDAYTTTSPIIINNLSPGTSYTVYLKAVSLNNWDSIASTVTASTYKRGSIPSISRIDSSINSIIVNFTQTLTGTPVPKYYYSYSSDGSNRTLVASSPFIISTTIQRTVYIIADSSAGTLISTTGVLGLPYVTGTLPSITNITPGLNKLTVTFNESTGGYPSPPTYYYSNISAGSPRYGPVTNPFDISGLLNATPYAVYIVASNTAGNVISPSYENVTPYVIGTTPSINSVTPGINSLTIDFNNSTNANPTPYYYYSYDGGATFTNSTYNSNSTPITISGLTLKSYSIQLKGVSEQAGNTAVSTATGIPYVKGTTPTITVTNGTGKIKVEYSQDISGTYTTTWFYYLNGTQYSAPASPFDISGTLLTVTSQYSIYMMARNPAGDIFSETKTGNVFGSKPNITIINGRGKITVSYSQDISGSSPTTWYYNLNGKLSSPVISNSFDISGTQLTDLSSYSIYMLARNSAGDISSNTIKGSVLGSNPKITVTNGAGKITVFYSQDVSGSLPTTWYYNLNGIESSVPSSNPFDISGSGLMDASSYSIYILARNPAGDISSNTIQDKLLGSKPNITVTNGLGKITVEYFQAISGISPTTWYYNLNGILSSPVISNPFDILGSDIKDASSYSIYILARNPAGDISSNTIKGKILGSKPNITITNGIGKISVFYSQDLSGNSPTNWKYYLNDISYSVPLSNPFDISGTKLTDLSSYSIYMLARNPSGDIYSSTVKGTVLGSTPGIEVTNGIGKITVRYYQDISGSSPTNWKYYLNDISYSVPLSNPFDISGSVITDLSSYSIYMLARNPSGDIYSSTIKGAVLGSKPNISIEEGIGKITVSYSQDNSGNSPTKWYYYLNDISYSVPLSNPFDISGSLLTDASSYSIYVLARNPAGDISSNTIKEEVFGSTPTIRITNGTGKITVSYSQLISGNSPTEWYYYLNDISHNAPASPFDISGSVLTDASSYSIYMLAHNPEGDLSSNTIKDSVFGSVPTLSLVSGINKLTATINQSISGSSPTAYYYSYYSNGSNPIGPVTYPSFDISGLTNSTIYTIYIVASNPAGSLVSSGVSGTPYLIGSAPSILAVSPVINSETKLTVRFTDSSGGTPALTKYQYSLNNGDFLDVSGIISPFTIEGLTAGTSYSVIMRAVSGSTWTSSNSIASTPVITYKIGSTPVIKTVTSSNNRLIVDFSGSIYGIPSPTTYFYSLDGGDYIDASSTTSPIVIRNLTISKVYNVTLIANNLGGNTVASNSVGGMPIIGETPITSPTYFVEDNKPQYWRKNNNVRLTKFIRKNVRR